METPDTFRPEGFFPIVAVGASAGGLDAFRRFVAAAPVDGGMAYILVQHLDPTHPSLIVDLLMDHSRLPVAEAEEGVSMLPGHIYVIPPRTFLSVVGNVLHLTAPTTALGARLPFDFLLNSLAQTHGERAAAVVLSGTGADGAAGAANLKRSGGLILAQDPDEAEYDGMPRAVIAAGVVDQVLSVSDLPAALVRHWANGAPRPPPQALAAGDDSLGRIVNLVRARTALDFHPYKPGTIRRRVERRAIMAGLKPGDFAGYFARLREDDAELDSLSKDLLINVTAFFRDPQIFDAVASKTAPALISGHLGKGPIRIWVAGCSTGQEAYSLAMVFLEALESAGSGVGLQIFASDVDDDAISQARVGVYPDSIASEVSAERLARFFTREPRGYRVKPALRGAVVFSVQDLLKDPPFSRLDMVSCRNLLIYLGPEAQTKAIALFHFSLRPGGVLLLGGSETTAHGETWFATLSKPERLYKRSEKAAALTLNYASPTAVGPRPAPRADAFRPGARFADLCRGAVVDGYGPPSVLVNGDLECVYALGELDHFLRAPSGDLNPRLLDMARDPFRPTLRTALGQAVQDQRRVVAPPIADADAASPSAVRIEVTPVMDQGETFFLVGFIETAANPALARPVAGAAGAPGANVAAVEAELKSTKAELRAAIRSIEVANAEQKAVTEEAQAVQEEYQSTNEELMTSKEELQSLNEELTALNTQLQETLERQRTTSSDLQHVLYSTNVATVFLDHALKIRFYTPATTALFSLIPTDIGRPLADLKSIADDTALLDDARGVLATLESTERQVEGPDGQWYGRRIFPYVGADKVISGVVLTFTNVTEQRRAAQALNLARGEAERANHAKSRFLAAASHDLRQPLQTLSLLQGLLAKTATEPNMVRLVSRFDETLGAMSGMLNTLLDINQIEEGDVRPNLETFPVGDILGRLKDEFAYHAHAKRLSLHVVETKMEITSDPHLLEQILRNMVSNALKYTPKGRILIGCRRKGDRLSIEVWDTGLGIPSESHAAIFEEYHQIGNEARERSKGVGLGLAIVRRLADLLGHGVAVRSRVGSGSVFSVEVPRIALRDRPAEPVAAEGAAASGLRSGTILLIEDDPELRDLLQGFLINEGHHVFATVTGPEALEILSHGAFRPDLILADFNLPGGMDGLQVSGRVKAMLHVPAPVVILTGDISSGLLKRIEDEGAVRLIKPVKTGHLAALIQRLLVPIDGAMATADTARRSAINTLGAPPMIFIVDDDAILREGLRETLEAEGRRVTDFASCEAFLEHHPPAGESCLLLDATLPGMSGLELLERLKLEGRVLPTIIITGHGDAQMAVQAMKSGASDFVEKPVRRQDLLACIDRAMGQSRDAAQLAEWRDDAARHINALTDRQRQIMDMVLAGAPSKNIAADLGISQRTVENHRASIMRRTGARSLPALARLAVAADTASHANASD